MKNLIEINNIVTCYSCNQNGFFCYTPDGADYNTCPLCTNYDYVNSTYMFDKPLHDKYFLEHDDNDISGINAYFPVSDEQQNECFNYCGSCKIVFIVGCRHACNGCTSCCYNGHLIGKWSYKGEQYIGMPQFDSIDELVNEGKHITIIEWFCPNNGLHCSGGSYPKSTNPQYYSKCRLCVTP